SACFCFARPAASEVYSLPLHDALPILLANLVVVPASSMVLVGTLLLTVIAPVRLLAVEMGKILEGLIWWLNSFIEIMGTFPLARSEEHTSELQSRENLVCRLLLEKKQI